jgi:hypothetical protein
LSAEDIIILDKLTNKHPTEKLFIKDLLSFKTENEDFILKHGLEKEMGKLLTFSLMHKFYDQTTDKYLKL